MSIIIQPNHQTTNLNITSQIRIIIIHNIILKTKTIIRFYLIYKSEFSPWLVWISVRVQNCFCRSPSSYRRSLLTKYEPNFDCESHLRASHLATGPPSTATMRKTLAPPPCACGVVHLAAAVASELVPERRRF